MSEFVQTYHGKSIPRAISLPSDLWQAARQQARGEERPVSRVFKLAITAYLREARERDRPNE